MAEDQANKAEQRGNSKVREGVVVSDKMDKTRVVAVTRLVKDRMYGKYVRKTKKYMAHDKNNESHTGDQVQIVETRPLSKNKRWRVRAVLTKAE